MLIITHSFTYHFMFTYNKIYITSAVISDTHNILAASGATVANSNKI